MIMFDGFIDGCMRRHVHNCVWRLELWRSDVGSVFIRRFTISRSHQCTGQWQSRRR